MNDGDVIDMYGDNFEGVKCAFAANANVRGELRYAEATKS